jgi:hypothetical protein
MKRLAVASVLASLASGAGASFGLQREVPDRPSEPFAVLVYTSPSEPDAPDSKYPLAKVVDEVSKRIEARKNWFLVTDSPERATIRVEVVRHSLNERMRIRLEPRVDATGTRKDWVDVSWVQEEHYLEARVEMPGGGQALVQGSDAREKGGSLKKAAAHLAENLELLCRERYWELETAR